MQPSLAPIEQLHRLISVATLPAAVYNVLTFERLSWGPLAAAAIVVTLPMLLLTIFIQKEIVAGLTAGGVKA